MEFWNTKSNGIYLCGKWCWKLRNMDPLKVQKIRVFGDIFGPLVNKIHTCAVLGIFQMNVSILHCGTDYLQNILNIFVWEKRQKRHHFCWHLGPNVSANMVTICTFWSFHFGCFGHRSSHEKTNVFQNSLVREYPIFAKKWIQGR